MSTTQRRAGLGFTQAVEDSERNAGQTENLVFRPGLNMMWQNKDNAVSFCILPAIPIRPDGIADKDGWLPYRNEQFQFSDWLSVFKQHRGFCKSMDVVGAQVIFGQTVLDPIDLIWNKANDDERFFPLIAKSPVDRKFSRDAYKLAFIRRPEWRVAVNAINPFDRETPNKVYLMVMSKTALIKYQYQGFSERLDEYRENNIYKAATSTWGLCEALDRLRDRPEHVLPALLQGGQVNFDNLFYEGDITNPAAMAVCQVRREASPQGGLDTYNCQPTPMGRVSGTMEQLRNRYDFGTEVFVDIEYPDLLDRLARAMLPVSKDLLYLAWSDVGPHFNAALSRNSVASGAVQIQGGMSRPGLQQDYIPGLQGDPGLPAPTGLPAAALPPPVTLPPSMAENQGAPALTAPAGLVPTLPPPAAPILTPPPETLAAVPASQLPAPGLPPAGVAQAITQEGGERRTRIREALGGGEALPPPAQ